MRYFQVMLKMHPRCPGVVVHVAANYSRVTDTVIEFIDEDGSICAQFNRGFVAAFFEIVGGEEDQDYVEADL